MRYVKYPNEYKTWINKLVRRFNFKLEFNGKTLTTNDVSSIKITSDLLPSDTFTIGSSVSETLEFDLFMDADTPINKSLPVKPYLSLYTEVEINKVMTPVYQEVCLGVFYVNPDGITKKGLKTISIKASSMINHNDYGGRTYVAQDPFNGNANTIINDICSKLGITLKSSLPSITISNRDNINGMKYREVINYIAMLYGGYARINNEGKLEFFKMKDTGYTYDTSNYMSISKEDETLNIKKFICALTENDSLSSGDGMISETVELVNPDMTQSLLDSILNTYKNYSYSSIKTKIFGNPILEPGDRIKIVDQKGKTLELPLQSITYNLSGSGLTMDITSKYKVNSIKNGTSIRKAVSQLNSDIIKTNIIVSEEIEATKAKFDRLIANEGEFKDLFATNASVENLVTEKLTAEMANIDELYAKKAEIDNLKADIAEIDSAIINKADITDLNAFKATVGELYATKAEIKDLNVDVLTSDLAEIKTLVNGNLTSDNIQSLILSSDKVTVENGFIKNAMIDTVSANKISAGVLSTNEVQISSDDGGMVLAGNTQQFKDKDGNVRIQLGQDAQGDFNFILKGEDGTTVLIDETGIKENAISDGLIKDNMIGTGEISGNKINISSLVTEINKDDNTSTIKGTKIMLDDQNQTLDLAFNSMKTSLDENTNDISTHTTSIGVMQGQIKTLISDTSITEDGQTKTIKDAYSSLKQTVNGINSTVGEHTTTIQTLDGKVTTVEGKQSSLEQNLNGFKTTVSETYSTKDDLGKVTNRVTNVENEITTEAITNKISSTFVLKNDYDKAISDIEKDLNDITIGGRNLVRNSDASLDNRFWSNVIVSNPNIIVNNTDETISDYTIGLAKIGTAKLGTYKSIPLFGSNSFKQIRTDFETGQARHLSTCNLTDSIKDSEYITLSGWFYIDSSVTLTKNSTMFVRRYYSEENFEDLCVIDYNSLEKDKWVYATISQKSNYNELKETYKSHSVISALSQNGLVYFSRIKVEKGNIPTDWSPAPEDTETYTDNLVSDLKEQVDGKIETWSQNNDPSNSWTTTDDKNKHKGDIWYNTDTKETKRWSGSSWVLLENKEAQEASALAQKKAQVFTVTPTIPYYKGDLWVTSTIAGKGVVKTCVITRTTGSYTASDWIENLKYTDDTLASKIQTDLNNLNIGGRNYIKDYKFQRQDIWTKQNGSTIDNENNCGILNASTDPVTLYQTFDKGLFNPGDVLTLQFEIKCEDVAANTGSLSFILRPTLTGYNDNGGSGSYVADVAIFKNLETEVSNYSDWTKVIATKTVSDKVFDFTRLRLYCRNFTGKVYFRNIKLERGNKATDLSPAPEDTEIYTDNLVSDLQEQLDGKIETYSQDVDPSTNWTTDVLKNNHKGDIWYNTSAKETKRWSGTAWVLLENKEAQDASALAQKKAQVFTGTPKVPYYKGDLWVTSTTAGKGVVKTCITARTTGSYTASDWVENLKYTDDTKANEAINSAADVKSRLDNLSIGGTNLLQSTNQGTIGWNWILASGSATLESVTENGIECCKMTRDNVECQSWSYIKYDKIIRDKFLPSTRYTLSFDVKPSMTTYFEINIMCGDGTNPLASSKRTSKAVANKWNKLSVTLTTLDTFPDNVDQILYISGMDSSPGVSYIFKNLMLEKGSTYTDWSPAPEDTDLPGIYAKISEGNANVIKAMEAYTKEELGKITSHVQETYLTQSEFGSFQEQYSSDLQQTSRDLTATFTEQISAEMGDYYQFKETVNTNIRFSSEGIEIGKTNSPFKSKFSNTKLSFLQNDKEVAFISNNKMYIENGEIMNQLAIGHFVFMPRDNGNMTLKWIN